MMASLLTRRTARASEKGDAQHLAKVDKNLALLKSRIATALESLRVPTRASSAEPIEKQVRCD